MGSSRFRGGAFHSLPVLWRKVVIFFFFKQKTAYEMPKRLEFRRVLFRSRFLARVREETSHGFLALAPQRALAIGGIPRFGWWRVDARSGETVAVTDEGLYQAGTSYQMRSEERRVGKRDTSEY